jgi:hypothetical protein
MELITATDVPKYRILGWMVAKSVAWTYRFFSVSVHGLNIEERAAEMFQPWLNGHAAAGTYINSSS